MENEKRLIDANEALGKFKELPDLQHFAERYVLYDSACNVLKNAPTVDAVEVVRCQNCGWWHRHKSGDLSRGVCDKYAMSKSENGYCDEPLLEERKLPWKK